MCADNYYNQFADSVLSETVMGDLMQKNTYHIGYPETVLYGRWYIGDECLP